MTWVSRVWLIDHNWPIVWLFVLTLRQLFWPQCWAAQSPSWQVLRSAEVILHTCGLSWIALNWTNWTRLNERLWVTAAKWRHARYSFQVVSIMHLTNNRMFFFRPEDSFVVCDNKQWIPLEARLRQPFRPRCGGFSRALATLSGVHGRLWFSSFVLLVNFSM